MRKTWVVGAMLAAGVLAAGFYMFQRPLATAIIAHVASERAGRDVIAGLPDGLHIILCGTGAPLPDPGRAGPCSVVVAGRHVFVVDAGEGGARVMNWLGVLPGRVEGVFLTHFHSDHIDGLGALMLMRWTGANATAPLPVHGPQGVEAIVEGFNAAYATDNRYRTAHHGPVITPPSGAGGVAVPFALPAPGHGDTVGVYAADGLRITAFRVDHGPVKPAIGYRFDYKGRSAVFSGDTRATPTLVAAARGADLLIHEGLQPRLVALLTEALEARGRRALAQITRDILTYHTTPEQAADEAREAGVKALVFSHILPAAPSRLVYPAFLGDAARHFSGKIWVGEDGMAFSMLPGQKSISERLLD